MPKPHVRRRRRFLVAAALALGRCAASSTLSVAPQPVQPRKRLALEAAPYAVGCAVAGAVDASAPPKKARPLLRARFPSQISTCARRTVTLPLDVLKTKIQSDANLARLGAVGAVRAVGAIKFGLYECGKRIFTETLAKRRPDVDVDDPATRRHLGRVAGRGRGRRVPRALPHGGDEDSDGHGPALRADDTRRAAARRPRERRGLAVAGGAPIMVRQVPYTVAKLAGYEALSASLGSGGVLPGVVAGVGAAAVSQPGGAILTRICGGSAKARLGPVALSMGDVPRRSPTRRSSSSASKAARPCEEAFDRFIGSAHRRDMQRLVAVCVFHVDLAACIE
ncbi:phosphate ion transmembrane transporter [Aureococcus anophagefferens]|uniref:Phosphate ion transmembrane transporter n=1 Tax=Aureococcus anophagefferens TaxID=44056 RepID=A0ABR1FL98_AURAN